MMVVKSLKSKGYLQDVFAWQWGYYFLMNDGVKFLVQELGKYFFLLWLLAGTPFA